MSHTLSRALLIACCLLIGAEAHAQMTPVGTWRTIDDNTGQARSVVEIVQQPDGSLAGYIRELTDPSRRDAICEVCPAEHGRNQPVIGLRIIWDVRQRGDDWRGGQILDPEEGKVYGVRMQPIDNGRRLEVRGFLRVPLMGSALGRTQTWERVQ